MAGDREVFQSRVAAMLARCAPGYASMESVERLSGGASQETYRIRYTADDGTARQLAMRRAAGGVDAEAGDSTRPGLATEAMLMRVAREAGVPEPSVYRVLEAGDALGAGFVMEWLEGETLGAKIARAPEFAEVREKLAFQCGEILARIHSIDLERSGLAEHLDTVTPEHYVRAMWETYKHYPTAQPMIDYTARWLLDHLPTDAEACLVHNDFRNGNLMLSPDGIVAVLDWELAHIGDPMRDLGWLCTNSWRFGMRERPVGGFGLREDLFAGYESVTGRPVDPERVRFWEVFGSYWWSVGCLQMADHYRNGPDKSVERPAIGRRSSECQVDCVNLLIPGPCRLVEAPVESGTEMPRTGELIESVRDFLRGDVMQSTQGRTQFLSRVAANALDIVQRELALGPGLRAFEQTHLERLFQCSGDLSALRWKLVEVLRDGSMALEHSGLAEYLREAVVNQVAIDQPRYSGYRHAVEVAHSAGQDEAE